MSLELTLGSTPPGIRATPWPAAIDPTGLYLRTPDEQIELTGADLAALVKYWLTNTDLVGTNDPRLELIQFASELTRVQGFNPGGSRLELLPIVERLQRRKQVSGSRPVLTPAKVAQCQQAFGEHPDWLGLYLFYDGHIESIADLNSRMTSRQAQLNSIASDGFPVYIGRGHSQLEEARSAAENPG